MLTRKRHMVFSSGDAQGVLLAGRARDQANWTVELREVGGEKKGRWNRMMGEESMCHVLGKIGRILYVVPWVAQWR